MAERALSSPILYLLTQHNAEKRLLRVNKVEAELLELGRLTQGEARMTATQTLEMAPYLEMRSFNG